MKLTILNKKIEVALEQEIKVYTMQEGETIIFIDDDCVPAPTFIENHMLYHCGNDNHVILGYKYRTYVQMLRETNPYKPVLMGLLNTHKLNDLMNLPENEMLICAQDIRRNLDRIVQLSYAGEKERWNQVYTSYAANMDKFVLPWLLFTTGNVSLKKKHCVEVGLFDENFKGWGLEDYEIGYRLYKHGLNFMLHKDPVIYRLMHSRESHGDYVASKVSNYIYFCQKHPSIEIYHHWRLSTRQWDIHTYNLTVQQYYNLVNKNQQIMKDYYQLSKDQCELYGCNIEYRRQKGR